MSNGSRLNNIFTRPHKGKEINIIQGVTISFRDNGTPIDSLWLATPQRQFVSLKNINPNNISLTPTLRLPAPAMPKITFKVTVSICQIFDKK